MCGRKADGSNTLSLSSLAHSDVTRCFGDSGRQAVCRLCELGDALSQFIMLCVLMRGSCIAESTEAAQMNRSESTVSACDLKDCSPVIRILNQGLQQFLHLQGGKNQAPSFSLLCTSDGMHSETSRR